MTVSVVLKCNYFWILSSKFLSSYGLIPTETLGFFSVSVESHLCVPHRQGRPHIPAGSPLSSLCLLQNCLREKKEIEKIMVFKTSRIMRRPLSQTSVQFIPWNSRTDWYILQWVDYKTCRFNLFKDKSYSGWNPELSDAPSSGLCHAVLGAQRTTLGTWWRVSLLMLLPWELSQSWPVHSVISLCVIFLLSWCLTLSAQVPPFALSFRGAVVQLCSPGEHSDTGFLTCPGPFHLTRGTQ